jgi:hypothetical protein
MNRLYIALFANAVLLAGLVIYQIWSGGGVAGDLFFKLIGTGITVGIFLSFAAILRMDFANLASKRLGWVVFFLALGLEIMALAAIWEIWVPDALFWKVALTGGILLGLAFYLLNLKEDLLREVRQKKHDYLD